MQYLMYIVIVVVMLAEFLSSPEVHLLPKIAKFLPEVLSLIVAAFVVVRGTHQNFRFVNRKYLLVASALTVVVICGAVVNDVEPGPILAGMRYYLRAMPFFFLPAVYDFKESQVKQLMKLLFFFSLLQVPIACYQRYVQATTGHNSGDSVYGTMMQSGVLSMYLICQLCVMTALALRGHISKVTLTIVFLLLVLPMSINETKITVLALPFGLFLTAIVGSPHGKRMRVSMYAATLLICGSLIFVPLYNFFNSWNNFDKDDPNKKTRIEDFFAQPDKILDYLNTKAAPGSHKEAGRVDALVVPVEVLAKDPVRFGFGLGIGNASTSMVGPQFNGRYQAAYGIYSVETSMATFTLEIGMFGAVLIALWIWMIYRDSMTLMRQDEGWIGSIALGWLATSILIFACNFYITIHTSDVVSYMFWFFSGLVAATQTRNSFARRKAYRRQTSVQNATREDLPATVVGNATSQG
jgi:hypothetical protein